MSIRSSLRSIGQQALRVGQRLRVGAGKASGNAAEQRDCSENSKFPSTSLANESGLKARDPTSLGEAGEAGVEVRSKEKKKKKTQAELDEELRVRLEGISGEGGGAGVEYEGGKAVGLKRGVKDNMFRVI